MELMVVVVIVGLVVAVAWPFVARRSGGRGRWGDTGQGDRDVTANEPVPPRRPDPPVAGSQPAREQHEKP